MAYLYYLLSLKRGVVMKELGEYLRRTRISNGVSITEACEDLEFSTSHLENIESGNIEVNHVQNVKLRTIVEPYVGPLGLSLLVILGYFAVRYKGTKEMLSLIKFLAIFEALLFCVYAICRVPVNGLTMPLFTLVFFGTIIGQTIVNEFKAKED